MLTTKTITPQQGKFYYAKENYYSTEEQQEYSRWFGVGALELNLRGEVKPEVFQNLLDAYLPKGEKFRTRKPTRVGYSERAGLDCTFSAPKSVSILALIKGDLKLEIAHRLAIERTLKILEERYATTRVRTDSGRKVVKTGNLVVGQFHHDTSRELDPHLHTHCVILNMTQLPNGKWYSLRDDDIHKNKKLLGTIYQNELAIEVQKLGYAIERTVHGQFEIKGFNREHIEYFSKRRGQIKPLLEENSTWAEREKIWARHRLAKGDSIPRHELMAYWQSEIKHLGLVYPVISQQPTVISQEMMSSNCELLTEKAVAEGIEHCSERSVAFKPEQIENFILSEVGKFSHAEVEKAILQSNELLYLMDDNNRVTTHKALLRELETIKLMLAGKQQVSPIATKEYVEGYLSEKSLTAGQREAIAQATTTTDQFLVWEGVAGAGKTFALNQFKAIALSNGYTLKGFAPSSAAASVLADELSIETNTVARLLCSNSKTSSLPPTPHTPEPTPHSQIWIVDEAGLLSANDAHALLHKATQENARVILVGDTRQLSAVEAGNPFKSLQQAGIKTAYLNQSLRQRTQDLKQAVDLIANWEIRKGINHLTANNRIVEIEDISRRHECIVADYMALAEEERNQTLILAGTNAERLAITSKIREALKEEGSLGEIATVTQLVPKDLTRVQMRYTHNFKKGDVVVPIYGSKKKGLEKGTQYQVLGTTKDRLILRASGSGVIECDTDFAKSVYSTRSIELAVKDKLKWTKNNHKLGRRNGQEFALASIEENTATIQYPCGKLEEINLDELQHLDYAIVSTTYSSQGKTCARVLIAADNTIASSNFYVAVSRAKHDLKLYTQDIGKLIELALKSRAKENPIELLKQKLKEQLKDEVLVGVKEMDSAEQIKKIQSEQKQLSKLTNPSKAQKTEISWLARTLKSWVAASSLNVGDVVTDTEKTGFITDWFIKGELVQALVQWEGWPPIPEDPARLYIVGKSVKNASTHESTHPRQSESIDGEDIGRRAGERLDTSSREVRQVRRSSDRTGELKPRNSPTPRTTQQPAAELQQFSNQSSHLIGRTERTNRQAGPAADRARPRIDPPKSTAFHTRPGVGGDEGGYSRDRKRSEGTSREFERAKQDFQAILERVRAIPLEEVAQRLGLERDRHDKHKWVSSEPFVRLSINNSKFFDHKAQKGGGGAIDLTMHLRGCSFLDAVQWLDSRAIDLQVTRNTPQKEAKSHALKSQKPESESQKSFPSPHPLISPTSPTSPNFVPPSLDASKWAFVKEYLVNKRGLPSDLVNQLNEEGILYADIKQNGVFIRKNLDGEITGASLRGTYSGSKFKGLAKNSDRSRGWFSFSTGEGELQHIVLVESSIDAISAAALFQKSGKTMFISTDGAGAVPADWLREQSKQGVKILVGYDRDRPGEEMAWQVARSLLSVTRLVPILGKDWNEQLLFIERQNSPSELDVSSWKTMANALGKQERYLERIEEVTLPLAQGQPLSDRALNALRLDEKTYKEIQTQLWQWLGAANALGKSEAYLRRIAEVAMEFNSIKPKALTEQVKTVMQQDLAQYRELLSISLAPELLLEASDTAAKVRTFVFKHGTMQSDQSIIFTGNQWRMELNGEALALVNYEHREILRVEGEKVVVFNPLPEERELMKELCAQMELERQQENFQQSEQETDRRRGRGR